MSIDAVVVTYNSAKTLSACLKSLRANSIKKIIVVDNASSDTSADIAEASQVESIRCPENRGFAAACNEGAKKCTSPYILFFNPDAVLENNALPQVEAYFEHHPDVAIIGLQLIDAKKQPQKDTYGREVTALSLFTRHFRRRKSLHVPTAVGWVSGGALCIRSAVFKKIGGFDPGYFLYWEDVDMCRSVQHQLHKKVVIIPNVQAIHQRGNSLNDQNQKTKLYDASADRYFRKHYSAMIWIPLYIMRRLYRFWQPLVR